jgi:hypothetical protein
MLATAYPVHYDRSGHTDVHATVQGYIGVVRAALERAASSPSPAQAEGGYNVLNIVLDEARQQFEAAASGAERERDEHCHEGTDAWVKLNNDAARYRWLAGEAEALRLSPATDAEMPAPQGAPADEQANKGD